VYTWLVELTFGLAGVLSTVTMVSPSGATIAAQLIRPRKNAGNRLFLSRVNVVLKQLIKSDDVAGDLIIRDAARACLDGFTAP
jgi:hypothetical protein